MMLIIKPPKSREDRRLEAMQREFDKQDEIDRETRRNIIAKVLGTKKEGNNAKA